MEGKKAQLHKNKVHKVLFHSYFAYFLLFVIAICLDLIFNLQVFSRSVATTGIVLLILGTILVFWAQKTSRSLQKGTPDKEFFSHGPYAFTRTPTNFGLFFLMLGCGMIANAFFVIFLSFFAFLIAKFIFLEEEEKILAEKYGAPYLAYKKSVLF
ncbi:MAG: methyltransferase [Candidatus Pacebacteria bacterium]|nr:methyltransferase [Candidatus Paceibacterota bacterium]